jgi:hypothetical protein
MDGDAAVPVEPARSAPLEQPRWSSLAQASLVFGIASLPLYSDFLCGVLAVVTGHLARRRLRKSQGTLIGSGMVLAGNILGYLSILLAVITIHDSSRSINLARNVTSLAHATGLERAIENFHAEYGALPDVGNHLTTDRADGVKLLVILLGIEPESGIVRNPRMIRFLNFLREGKNKRGGLIYNSTGTLPEGLYDAWGNPFTVELAKPGERNFHFTIGAKTIDLAGRRVAVYSPGMDKALGTADDIRTW